MAFDPSQPFEVVGQGAAAPAFDPSKPFDVVGQSHSIDDLQKIMQTRDLTPEERAQYTSLKSQTNPLERGVSGVGDALVRAGDALAHPIDAGNRAMDMADNVAKNIGGTVAGFVTEPVKTAEGLAHGIGTSAVDVAKVPLDAVVYGTGVPYHAVDPQGEGAMETKWERLKAAHEREKGAVAKETNPDSFALGNTAGQLAIPFLVPGAVKAAGEVPGAAAIERGVEAVGNKVRSSNPLGAESTGSRIASQAGLTSDQIDTDLLAKAQKAGIQLPISAVVKNPAIQSLEEKAVSAPQNNPVYGQIAERLNSDVANRYNDVMDSVAPQVFGSPESASTTLKQMFDARQKSVQNQVSGMYNSLPRIEGYNAPINPTASLNAIDKTIAQLSETLKANPEESGVLNELRGLKDSILGKTKPSTVIEKMGPGLDEWGPTTTEETIPAGQGPTAGNILATKRSLNGYFSPDPGVRSKLVKLGQVMADDLESQLGKQYPQLVKTFRTADKIYGANADLINETTMGTLLADAKDPAKLLDRIDTPTKVDELKQIFGNNNPVVNSALRAKVEDVFGPQMEAGRFNYKKLGATMEGQKGELLKSILGPDAHGNLSDLADVANAIQKRGGFQPPSYGAPAAVSIKGVREGVSNVAGIVNPLAKPEYTLMRKGNLMPERTAANLTNPDVQQAILKAAKQFENEQNLQRAIRQRQFQGSAP